MSFDVLLAPDVFANAAVALGSPPEKVVNRLLGGDTKSKTTKWVLAQVAALLGAHPSFNQEALPAVIQQIASLMEIVDHGSETAAGEWETHLVGIAHALGCERVVSDHPDLVGLERDGVEFISSEAWLLEASMPPPVPSANS